MGQSYYDYCIVGAGACGLTAAYKLLQGGKSVLLIERDDRIGGLAKSHYYDGNIFDTGPKRFHSDDPVVTSFIDEISEGAILRISRSTKVHFLGKYFEWPLHSQEVLKMPLAISFKCFRDLLGNREIRDSHSFHEYIRAKYGETLYTIFFQPYTQKFLRWDPEDIHADWATTGINRTVIDKRINTNTLLDVFKTLMLPAKIDTEFLYPEEGGFGGFYEKLLTRCQRHAGFSLNLKDTLLELEEQGERFTALTKTKQLVSFDHLIWTGNLNDLFRLLGLPHKLYYLNTIFYNIIAREEGIGEKKAQWIYVSRGDSLISRITCMKEFAAYTCKAGCYNVICELTDSQAAPAYFYRPQEYTDGILKELTAMGFLKDAKCVEDVKINPVVDTYPIYHKRYVQDFDAASEAIRKYSPRIHLAGRSGTFWYNNSDHSIRFAIELAKRLLENGQEDFDYRSYFGGQPKQGIGKDRIMENGGSVHGEK